MLDSDNLPLRNPEYLFESAEYRGSGSLFFSDWWDILDWVKPEAYTAFGLQYPSFSRPTLAAESGQLLLNRLVAPTRHLAQPLHPVAMPKFPREA